MASMWVRLCPPALTPQAADLAGLRLELRAEHERLLNGLKGDLERLRAIDKQGGGDDLEDILLAYGTLIAIAQREDFESMSSKRLPVVIAHISSRLERLEKLLRSAEMHNKSTLSACRDPVQWPNLAFRRWA